MKRAVEFSSEAELCAAFIAWLGRWPEWTAYPETAGWDILLAHRDGTQVGVQAKLKFNIKVLQQAIDSWLGYREAGPDFRAVLLPSTEGDESICSALGLGLIRGRADRPFGIGEPTRYSFNPQFDRHHYRAWHFQNPEKRHALPQYVPDVVAGASAPTQLTRWKVAALEIAATLELRDFVTRDDFRRAGIDHRRWTQVWLVPDLKSGGWRRGEQMPDFAAQHPVVYPKVLADVRKRLLVPA